jgi:hypothetical protein
VLLVWFWLLLLLLLLLLVGLARVLQQLLLLLLLGQLLFRKFGICRHFEAGKSGFCPSSRHP